MSTSARAVGAQVVSQPTHPRVRGTVFWDNVPIEQISTAPADILLAPEEELRRCVVLVRLDAVPPEPIYRLISGTFLLDEARRSTSSVNAFIFPVGTSFNFFSTAINMLQMLATPPETAEAFQEQNRLMGMLHRNWHFTYAALAEFMQVRPLTVGWRIKNPESLSREFRSQPTADDHVSSHSRRSRRRSAKRPVGVDPPALGVTLYDGSVNEQAQLTLDLPLVQCELPLTELVRIVANFAENAPFVASVMQVIASLDSADRLAVLGALNIDARRLLFDRFSPLRDALPAFLDQVELPLEADVPVHTTVPVTAPLPQLGVVTVSDRTVQTLRTMFSSSDPERRVAHLRTQFRAASTTVLYRDYLVPAFGMLQRLWPLTAALTDIQRAALATAPSNNYYDVLRIIDSLMTMRRHTTFEQFARWFVGLGTDSSRINPTRIRSLL